MTVTVEGLKAQLNLDGDEENALLALKIIAAKGWIANYIGVSWIDEDDPAPLQEAVLQLAAHLYEHRGDGEDDGIPFTVVSLIMPYRSWTF